MTFFKKKWCFFLLVLLLSNTIIMGFLEKVPNIPIIEESIRNLYFHVCMWFSMMLSFIISFVYGIKFLISNNLRNDIISESYSEVGFIFGLLGLITGSVWAKFTWGEFWSGDAKQIGTIVALLIYASYLVLRKSILNKKQKAKISSVYNLFAFSMLFPTIWILPRLVESLHPGAMGNPALNSSDIDSKMRIIFYLSVIGWSILCVWISSIRIKMKNYYTS